MHKKFFNHRYEINLTLNFEDLLKKNKQNTVAHKLKLFSQQVIVKLNSKLEKI